MWVPIVVVAVCIGSATLTVRVIIPINRRMAAGIQDDAELQRALARWRTLTQVRVALWSTEWLALAIFFAVRARS